MIQTPHTNQDSQSIAGARKATLGAFALSVIIHGVALLLVGGYVIFEGVIPKTPFMEVDTPHEPDQNVDVMPEVEPEMEMPETPPASSELVPSAARERAETGTPMDVLISTSTNSSFDLPPAVGAPTSVPNLSGTLSTRAEGSEERKPGPSSVRTLSTLFGSKGTDSSSLVGHFYDLKQTADRKPTEMAREEKGKNDTEAAKAAEQAKNALYVKFLNDFTKSWNEKELQPFYRARNSLSTTQLFIPLMNASEAPKAFDVEKEVEPTRWLIHYKGTFIAPKSGTFRFVGFGDDILVVRFDNKPVLQASIFNIPNLNDVPRERVGSLNFNGRDLVGGEWFRLTEGRSYPIEILMGEIPGGFLAMFLNIQEKGASYSSRVGNVGPILPVFQTVPTKLPDFAAEKTGPQVAKEGFAGWSR